MIVSRGGFTLMEVVLIILVVTLGLLGAVGLASYGMALASKSQGMSLGMATAMSVAVDSKPLMSTDLSASWTPAAIDLDSANAVSAVTTGYINGFYVKRTESSQPEDIIAKSGSTVYVRYCTVDVDVFGAINGSVIASFTTQVIRQRGVK